MMTKFRGSTALAFLAAVAGCSREAEIPPSQIRRPPPPMLRALNETAFEPLTADKTNHVYRFICSRTFHEPFSIVFRVAPDGSGVMAGKMLSGAGGYKFGGIKEQHEATVTAAKVSSFLTVLDQEKFWNLESGDGHMGADGSWWFIEGVRTNHYQFVGRWSRDTNTPAGRIGRHLIELADWKIEHLD
jgi:hypothetical protein